MNEISMIETPEQIARHYSAAMDSVALINGPARQGATKAEWQNILAQNKEHLKIMLAKEYWTTEDLEPLRAATGS